MTQDLQEEYQLLREAAKVLLRDIPVSGSYRNVFSIWVWPSFTPAIRWTIYSPRRLAQKHQPFASGTIWRSDLDGKKLASPVERLKHPKVLVPTIENMTVDLKVELIQEFENSLEGLSIPIFKGMPSAIGCDGTSYEFSYNKFFYGASLSWWEDHPVEWRPFIRAVLEIIQTLEALQGMKTPADASNGQ